MGILTWESHGNFHVGILWESYGNSHRKPVRMGWEYELKFHSHGNPVNTSLNDNVLRIICVIRIIRNTCINQLSPEDNV